MIEIIQSETFSKWLLKLRDGKARDIIMVRLLNIMNGHLGDHKRFEGLIEFRIFHRPGYRLYAVQRGNSLIFLLCGGDKSTQKKDIEKAKKLMKEVK